MSERLDAEVQEWPQRPWIMAAICSVAGLAFHLLTDRQLEEPLPAIRQAAATFVAIATVSFVLTVERLRWTWSAGFALGWGAVLALIGWFTARYNVDPTIFEWPYLSGMFAVLLAAPLFQTVRDEGAWRFPYGRLHSHAWTDAVIGAAALGFTGVVFLMAWLISGLFDLIGIGAIRDLVQEEWFGWMLAGFAFGAAVGLLRERDRLVATLQRLVMVVFAVLAPVLAVALVLFLASIPFTGLDKLWDGWVPATPLLLAAGAGALLLANAVVGDGREERSPSRLMHWSAMALVAVILPMAAIAAYAMQIRIDQYGWTPERIWGVIAVAVAAGYGAVGWWTVWRGRSDFDESLRPAQTKLALGLCGLALLLALPIVDFGGLSTRSQVARLESGRLQPLDFDWRALAFDFGPSGRRALREIAQSGPAAQRALAATALQAKSRWGLSQRELAAGPPPAELTIVPNGAAVPVELRRQLLGGEGIENAFCSEGGACRVYPQPGGTFIVFLDSCANLPGARRNDPKIRCTRSPGVFEMRDGKWANIYGGLSAPRFERPPQTMSDEQESALLEQESEALDRGNVRIEEVTMRRLVVGGKPAGDPFR